MRDLDPSFVAELTAPTVRPVFLLASTFEDTEINLWTGTGAIAWDGKTFLGNGWLQAISPVREISAVQAEGLSVQLTGIPQDVYSLILSKSQHNRDAARNASRRRSCRRTVWRVPHPASVRRCDAV